VIVTKETVIPGEERSGLHFLGIPVVSSVDLHQMVSGARSRVVPREPMVVHFAHILPSTPRLAALTTRMFMPFSIRKFVVTLIIGVTS